MPMLERLHKLRHEIRKAIPEGPTVINSVITKLLTCSVYLQTKSVFIVPSVEDTCSAYLQTNM